MRAGGGPPEERTHRPPRGPGAPARRLGRGAGARIAGHPAGGDSGRKEGTGVERGPLRSLAPGYFSSRRVTGPSLTSSTSISSPNDPVSTGTPEVALRRRIISS